MTTFGVSYKNIFGPTPYHFTTANSAARYIGIDATASKNLRLYGLTYWCPTSGGGNHLGWLRHIGPGTNLMPVFFPFPIGANFFNAWNRAYFPTPVDIASGDEYRFLMQIAGFDYEETIPTNGNPPWTFQDWTVNSVIDSSAAISFNPPTSISFIAPLVDVLYTVRT